MAIRPKVGARVTFGCWNGGDAPEPKHWTGTVTAVHKSRYFPAIYSVLRDYDKQIQTVEGRWLRYLKEDEDSGTKGV